jgi:hypothetical protein
MNKPLELDPTGVLDFVARPEPAVLFLSAHPAHRFNPCLCECFVTDPPSEVAFAQLMLWDLVTSASPALTFLHREIQACGAAVPLAIPPGYYLFQGGQMLAWDSGLPSATDAKGIIRGSLFGAALSLFTRNWRFVGIGLRYAAEQAAAARIAARFRQAAQIHRDNPRPQSERTETTYDELSHAYRVLGVSPTATDEEVTRAWRVLQRKFHPDRAANDPEAFDHLSRRCVEINQAREIIRNHRKHMRANTTAC